MRQISLGTGYRSELDAAGGQAAPVVPPRVPRVALVPALGTALDQWVEGELEHFARRR